MEWIGYLLDYTRFQMGISRSRCRWLLAWGDRILLDGVVVVRAMTEGSWCAAAPGGAILQVPSMLKLALSFILQHLREGRRTVSCRFPVEDQGEILRTDDGCLPVLSHPFFGSTGTRGYAVLRRNGLQGKYFCD